MFNIDIINHILSFRPTHPVGLLVRNNVRKLLEDYTDYEYKFEELKDEFGEEDYDIMLYECQINILNPISLYRKQLLWNKKNCENDIIIYSNENNYNVMYDSEWGRYNTTPFGIDPINYEYIDECKNRLIKINKLLTIFKDIDFDYKYNVNWEDWYNTIDIDTVEEYIIKKTFISKK